MTLILPRTSIKLSPARQRQEFDPQKLEELRASIELNGLLHAPVVRRTGEGFTLVAGERRLKAMADLETLGVPIRYNGQALEPGMVAVTDLGELSILEAEEAELDENLKRADLTWQEHSAAVARLHDLRREQAVLKGAVHTVADTAREVLATEDVSGSPGESVRREILVSKHLDNPAIAKAKSADEAFKILRKAEETTRNVALAATVGATFNADKHTLLNRDCLAWMMEPQNAERFDVICTDPPYGMGADGFGDGGGKLSGIEHRYDDSPEAWAALMQPWTTWSYRVCKPQAHAYVFCDIDNFHQLRDWMRAAGWYVFRTPLIVHKLNSGRVPLPDQGPRRCWEAILYAIKGKKNVTHIYPDVIPVAGDENLTHGAQKPVALFQNLLQRSVLPGDAVLDCFAGTGPIFEAGHTFKCSVTGLELNPEYYALSLQRIRQLKALEAPGTLA
jgi:DNA modification methylase/ParB-like chromosome segregation protein Spo0J